MLLAYPSNATPSGTRRHLPICHRMYQFCDYSSRNPAGPRSNRHHHKTSFNVQSRLALVEPLSSGITLLAIPKPLCLPL